MYTSLAAQQHPHLPPPLPCAHCSQAPPQNQQPGSSEAQAGHTQPVSRLCRQPGLIPGNATAGMRCRCEALGVRGGDPNPTSMLSSKGGTQPRAHSCTTAGRPVGFAAPKAAPGRSLTRPYAAGPCRTRQTSCPGLQSADSGLGVLAPRKQGHMLPVDGAAYAHTPTLAEPCPAQPSSPPSSSWAAAAYNAKRKSTTYPDALPCHRNGWLPHCSARVTPTACTTSAVPRPPVTLLRVPCQQHHHNHKLFASTSALKRRVGWRLHTLQGPHCVAVTPQVRHLIEVAVPVGPCHTWQHSTRPGELPRAVAGLGGRAICPPLVRGQAPCCSYCCRCCCWYCC
jgi:hypothetical protein